MPPLTVQWMRMPTCVHHSVCMYVHAHVSTHLSTRPGMQDPSLWLRVGGDAHRK